MNLLGEPAFVGRHCGSNRVVNETDVMHAETAELLVRGHTHQSFLPPKRDQEKAGFVVDEGCAAGGCR